MEFVKIDLDEFENYIKAYTKVYDVLRFVKLLLDNPKKYTSLKKEAIEACSKAIKGLDEVKSVYSYSRAVTICMRAITELEKASVERDQDK
jgi:isoleucyl-tRNA synthetase